jgi:hypothetical protein
LIQRFIERVSDALIVVGEGDFILNFNIGHAASLQQVDAAFGFDMAKALCRECHLEDHQGPFRRRKSNQNAGYAERCSPNVKTAEPKPAIERE